MSERKGCHAQKKRRGTAQGLMGRLQRFADTRVGRPVLAGSAVALCALLGVGAYLLAACAPAEAPSSAVQSSAASSAASAAAAAADSSYDAQAGAIDTAAFTGTILPETEDAGESYVDGTLFIGDSNSYRYMSYGFTSLDNDIAVIGMGVEKIETLGCVKFKNQSGYVTIAKAVKIMQPERVVFGFGTNNLTGDAGSFIDTYEQAIQSVYESYPYFDVIVNAIPPVDKNRSYPNVTMQNVDEFNEAIAEMCEANGWKFLNSSEALKDEKTGFAKTSYTISDGLHLSKDGCTALFDYIRTHAYESTDRRPKPLSKVPERAETPPDLITSDPLKSANASSSSKIDVTFTATEGGTLTGSTEQSVRPGANCTAVTAVPAEGYVFSGWSCTSGRIDDTAAAELTFTVPSDSNAFGGIVVTATFEPVAQYTVTFKVSNAAGATLGAENADAVSINVKSGGTAGTYITLNAGYTAVLDKASQDAGAELKDGKVTVTNVTQEMNIVIVVTAAATPTPAATAVPATQAPASPSPSPSPTPEPASSVPTAEPASSAASAVTAPSASPDPGAQGS